MMQQITWDIIESIFKMKLDDYDQSSLDKIEREKERELDEIQIGTGDDDSGPSVSKREGPKVGRNDMCNCGSGKKYKHCCGS